MFWWGFALGLGGGLVIFGLAYVVFGYHATGSLADLKSKLSENGKHLARAESDLTISKTELKERDRAIVSLRDEIKSLKEKLQQTQNTLTDTKASLEDARKQNLTEVERVERIREMERNGKSKRQIELAIFGYAGGAATKFVKDVLLQDSSV